MNWMSVSIPASSSHVRWIRCCSRKETEENLITCKPDSCVSSEYVRSDAVTVAFCLNKSWNIHIYSYFHMIFIYYMEISLIILWFMMSHCFVRCATLNRMPISVFLSFSLAVLDDVCTRIGRCRHYYILLYNHRGNKFNFLHYILLHTLTMYGCTCAGNAGEHERDKYTHGNGCNWDAGRMEVGCP